ncbi:hypothetical protein ACKI1I_27095 [Streptomyces turgidiscabies]|uniref:Uncharacterized protein n=1 Tax=Streptomyces turgidiscabies (strain Car8) TaxID=698760 RepID=L7F132_STRT8|nr:MULTISPECIES: hypothetical protein [Streptomyces]ELP64859.1 hypothetical protein STRTUCAR8_03306 [Streptomyces turgidiscabies Car8]MDX3494333.1 hypothetical protein [Streptomyces turgidiscabies]
MASASTTDPESEPEPEPDSPPRPRRWLTPLTVTLCAAAIGAVATLGVPIVTEIFDDDVTPPPTPTNTETPPPIRCNDRAVQINAPDQVGSTFETTTTVLCPPSKGTKYYFISQEDNVGEKGTEHSVYCPKESILPGEETSSYTTKREVQRSPVGSKKSLYYLQVNAAQEQELFTNLVDTCAWKLPLDARPISNTVTIQRLW